MNELGQRVCLIYHPFYIIVSVPDTSNNHSGLSHGEIASIAVSLIALVIVVILAILYGMRNCWDYKKLIYRPQKDIQIGKFVLYLFILDILHYQF